MRSNRPEAASSQLAAMKPARAADAQPAGVGGGAGERGGAYVGADALGAGQLGEQGEEDAAGAGAEIEQPERPLAPALPIDDGESRLDQRLGVGTRVEHRGVDAEGPAVELAAPHDARHRLMLGGGGRWPRRAVHAPGARAPRRARAM